MSASNPTAVAPLGTRTTHGGIVTTATSGLTIDGRPVARVGDEVQCPEHGKTVIIDGGLASIGGRNVAHHGSQTSCGATLVVGAEGGPTA